MATVFRIGQIVVSSHDPTGVNGQKIGTVVSEPYDNIWERIDVLWHHNGTKVS